MARAADPLGGWHVAGASVTGSSHQRRGVGCQDACHGEVLPDGTLIVAIADGAGSAPRSADAAGVAVEAAVARVRNALLGPARLPPPAVLLTEAFVAARAAVVESASRPVGESARRDGGSAGPAAAPEAVLRSPSPVAWPPGRLADSPTPRLRDYATTLLLAVAAPRALWVAQRGDGVAVARDRGGRLFLAAAPQNGEYANETFFLTDPAGDRLIFVAAYPPVDAVALLTDGVQPLALRLTDLVPHAPFFDPVFAFARDTPDPAAGHDRLAAFLRSERVTARTDDDATLVVAVRPAGPDDGAPAATARAPAPDR